MESLLDAIQYNVWSKHVWRNGKEGSISGHPNEKEKWVFRFFEPLNERWQDGPLFELSSDKIEEAVPVCKGIAACYLALRRGDQALKDIYDIYTKERYEQYKKDHRLDTDKCDWWTADWERDFYCNYIIPHETELNDLSKPLFDYLPECDAKTVHDIVDTYMARLEKRRKEILTPKDNEIFKRLVPYFNSEECAKRYVEKVRGLKDTEIAIITNKFWNNNMISEDANATAIWRVLHDNGIYTSGERNWRGQVNFNLE